MTSETRRGCDCCGFISQHGVVCACNSVPWRWPVMNKAGHLFHGGRSGRCLDCGRCHLHCACNPDEVRLRVDLADLMNSGAA